MTDDTDDTMNRVVQTRNHQTHTIVTGEFVNEPGYAAWKAGYPGLRTTGETQYEAIYHLAATLDGMEDEP